MEIQRQIDEIGCYQEQSAISLGKFDGIHRGHRLLLDEILHGDRGVPTVLTFEGIHSGAESRIYTEQETSHLLRELGIVREVLLPFNEQIRRMSPTEFIVEILWNILNASYICVGEDFRFGYQRSGDIKTLEEACRQRGCRLQVHPRLADEEATISSTRIRRLIKTGELARANELLASPFFFMGEVMHGKALGRNLRMPTANLLPAAEKVLPPAGVYTSRVTVQNRMYGGVTNIGNNPTVGGSQIKAETHILDFDRDIYGQQIKVELLAFQRSEKAFANVEALREQMERDKIEAKEALQRDFA